MIAGDSSSSPSLLNLPHWRQQTSPVSGPSPAMTELANLVNFSTNHYYFYSKYFNNFFLTIQLCLELIFYEDLRVIE